MLLYTWMIYWSSLAPSMLASELEFLVLFLIHLGIPNTFSKLEIISHSIFLFWAYVGIVETCLSLYHLTDLLKSSSWLMPCSRGDLLQFIRLYLFGARPPLCQWLWQFCHVIQSDHSFAHLVPSFHLPTLHPLWRLSQL